MRRTTRPAPARWPPTCEKPDGPAARSCSGRCATRTWLRCWRRCRRRARRSSARRRALPRAMTARVDRGDRGAAGCHLDQSSAVADPAAALEQRRARVPARRGRRLHLLDRSAAWYSAATIAALPASRSGVNASLLPVCWSACVSIDALRPCIASAADRPVVVQGLLGRRGAALSPARGQLALLRHRGSARRRSTVDDMQFFADYTEIFKKKDLVIAHGTRRVRLGRQPHLRPTAMEFNTKTSTGTFYNARGNDDPRRRGPRPRSLFGTQEPDACSGASEIAEDRAQEIPDHPRRLHDLRAADAALGARVGHGHAQPRRLRAADELAVPGQGRAADVSAGLLLPDPGRRPRHRVPDSDLRVVDRQGPDRSATRSSGRSDAATTPPSITTG